MVYTRYFINFAANTNVIIPDSMTKSIRIFLSAAIALISVAACTRQQPSGLEGLKWESIDPFTDSINSLLEKEFYMAEDPDSMTATAAMLKSHARSADPRLRRPIMTRFHFWNARILSQETDLRRAKAHIDSAKAICDSAIYPYTHRRIGIIRQEVSPASGDNEIRRQMEDLEYFMQIGDRPMEAYTNILIGLTLNDSYQPRQALEYLYKADSVSKTAGLTLLQKKNRINISECLYKTGDSVQARRLLRQLLADTAVRSDFRVYNIVLRNASLRFGESEHAREAYRRTLAKDPSMPLNAICEMRLCRIYLRGNGRRDTALADEYGRRAFARIADLDSWETKAEILHDAAERYARTGNRDSAYICQSLYIAAKDSSNKRRHAIEVSRVHNMKEISRIEAEKESNRQKYIARMLILSIVVLLLIAAAIYIESHHRHRHRIEEQKHISENLKTQLEIERYQRQFLAVSLAIEETDRNLSEIKERISQLRKEGKINDREARQVEDVIRKHTAQRDDWNRFRELFDKTHPLFLKNLKETYPGLSETQMRLATYIYTGMDNKQIADFLNIRAESVKQSRWRLRVKMGLQAGDSLEDALRALSTAQ